MAQPPDLLEKVKAVLADREGNISDPSKVFGDFFALADPIMKSDLPDTVKMAIIMGQLKVARLINRPVYHEDDFVDWIGYAVLADKLYSMISAKPPAG